MLSAARPSHTPTLLFRLGLYRESFMLSFDWAANGMFLVQNGRDSFFAPVHEHRGYRFDPGCMTPCDVRAHNVVQYMAEAAERAVVHKWSEDNRILVIDNRQTVHARAALVEGDEDRELTRIAFRLGQAQ
jgi:hypothetical protein